MNIYPSQKWETFMGSLPIRSENGLKALDSERPMADQANKPLPMDSSNSGKAETPIPIIGSGTGGKPLKSSTEWETQKITESFWVRQSGNIGQEIIDQDGRIIAWTTDFWTARVICKLLNDNEGLLFIKRFIF